MNELQNMVQSRRVIHTQTDHHKQRQLPDSPAVHQRQQMGPPPMLQDIFMPSEATTLAGSYHNASQGFDRGSVPLVQRHASAGTAPANGDEHEGYSSLRQNAVSVPHPSDSYWGRGSRGRRDFHSWNNTRSQRMQGYDTQTYGLRRTSAGNEFRGGNNQQNIPDNK